MSNHIKKILLNPLYGILLVAAGINCFIGEFAIGLAGLLMLGLLILMEMNLPRTEP